jgi:cytochrome c-type biogenesis protein CcmE
MGNRWFLAGAGTVAVGLIGVLLWSLLDANTVYYLEPREALADRERLTDGTSFRLGGVIVPGSIEADGDNLRFVVTDFAAEIEVSTKARTPELFGEEIPVILEGAFLRDRFVADAIILRHEEEYRAPDHVDPDDVVVPGEGAAP